MDQIGDVTYGIDKNKNAKTPDALLQRFNAYGSNYILVQAENFSILASKQLMRTVVQIHRVSWPKLVSGFCLVDLRNLQRPKAGVTFDFSKVNQFMTQQESSFVYQANRNFFFFEKGILTGSVIEVGPKPNRKNYFES